MGKKGRKMYKGSRNINVKLNIKCSRKDEEEEWVKIEEGRGGRKAKI